MVLAAQNHAAPASVAALETLCRAYWYPLYAFARHELASLAMDQGDFRAAIAHLKEVLRLKPADFDANLDLGICYAQKGFYAEAEKAYAMIDAGAEPHLGMVLEYPDATTPQRHLGRGSGAGATPGSRV